MNRSLEQRFQERVRRTDGCWIWIGQIHHGRGGYGKIRYQNKFYRAHRLAWEMANGPVPKGMFVCHRCDNPPCVRPDHLFLGTPGENDADKRTKGREASHVGEGNGRAKLTEDDVRAVRRAVANGFTRVAVARTFGIAKATVYGIVTRRIWPHVIDEAVVSEAS